MIYCLLYYSRKKVKDQWDLEEHKPILITVIVMITITVIVVIAITPKRQFKMKDFKYIIFFHKYLSQVFVY